MFTKSLTIGAIAGLSAGLIVSIAMTTVDWWLNPSGIFHNEHATNWAIVLETAGSWFWPVSLGAFALAAVVHSLVSRARQR